MPKLPTNMVTRKGRAGYYFRKKFAGKDKWIALGTDYGVAAAKLRKLRDDDCTPRSDLTVPSLPTCVRHRPPGSLV